MPNQDTAAGEVFALPDWRRIGFLWNAVFDRTEPVPIRMPAGLKLAQGKVSFRCDEQQRGMVRRNLQASLRYAEHRLRIIRQAQGTRISDKSLNVAWIGFMRGAKSADRLVVTFLSAEQPAKVCVRRGILPVDDRLPGMMLCLLKVPHPCRNLRGIGVRIGEILANVHGLGNRG